MGKKIKVLVVIVGALALTTLGISASDTIQGLSGSLLSNVMKTQEEAGCGEDAVEMMSGERVLCVDRFEASTGAGCVVKDPANLRDSDKNLDRPSCTPVSALGGLPWRFVNLSQAQRACAQAGKRLMTNAEWYRAALGTASDASCILDQAERQTPERGRITTCRSTIGAYDMVGNVWEWVDASVQDGTYARRTLPGDGFVAGVDQDGVTLMTTEAKDTLYGDDYFWGSQDGMRGMIRGGFFGSKNDGGLYALNSAIDLSFGSQGVGFRCVRERD